MRLRVTRRADAQIDQPLRGGNRIAPTPQAPSMKLAEAFALLAAQPGIGAPALNARTRGVKRILLARIHYWLYYRVRGDEVAILALWHTSRGAGPTL